MEEKFLQKLPSKNSSSSDTYFLFAKDESYNAVIATLKNIQSRSELQRKLGYILGTFYSCQTSFIFISLTIGVLIIGIPLLLIYNNLINNIAIPFLIIAIISIIFSLILIVMRILDGKAKNNFLKKFQRKNILKNIGIIFTLIILIISIGFAINFYSIIIQYKGEEKIIIDISGSTISKKLATDFLFKYIINMAFFCPKDINSDNENYDIKFYINDDEEINNLRNKLIYALIPLLLICFNKIIKCIIIEVKFTIAQLCFFFGGFFCCLISAIINNKKLEDIINLNINVISNLEFFSIIIIYIGYISWILHSSFKLIRNPKDKNFSIRKYSLFNLILIILIDFITLVGASFIVLSLVYFYLSIIKGEENLKNLKLSFIILKFGFLLIIIGNSYYYGHYLLSMIFRPISIEYAPYELKNHNYIKTKRNLINILVTKKKRINLEEVLHKE